MGSILIVTVVAHPGIGRYIKYRNFNESCVKTEQIVISPFPCISHLLYEKKNVNLAVNWENGSEVLLNACSLPMPSKSFGERLHGLFGDLTGLTDMLGATVFTE